MIKKIKWEWESLDECTKRARVIGGWLILRLGATDIEKNKRVQFRESIVFLADRDHEWQIIKPVNPDQPPSEKLKAADFESPKKA